MQTRRRSYKRSWKNKITIGLFIVLMGAIVPTYLSVTYHDPLATVGIIRPLPPAPVRSTQTDEHCLTQAIYYEAGHEPTIGKEAVALVILNRVGQKSYAKTVCGVVHQMTLVKGVRICQFSYHCLPLYPPQPDRWKEAKGVARQSLKNVFHRDTLLQVRDARYFHANYVSPKWAKKKQYVAKIGTHLFYKEE